MALRNERAARSVNAGHLIAAALGLVFVGANSGSLEPGPRVALVLAAVSVALVPVVAAVRVHVLRRENPWSRTVGIDRSVWIAIGVEAFAMALGLGVLQQTATAILVAWVACVVGFSLLLMAIWWAPGPAGLRAVGILLTGLGVAGFTTGFLGGSAEAVALLSGVGSGAVLLAATLVVGIRSLRLVGSVSAR